MNDTKPLQLDIILKINDTKKSNSNNPLQFYIRKPFKINHIKKIHPGTLIPLGVLTVAQKICCFRDLQTDVQRQSRFLEKPSYSSKKRIMSNVRDQARMSK